VAVAPCFEARYVTAGQLGSEPSGLFEVSELIPSVSAEQGGVAQACIDSWTETGVVHAG
jgi:hypothetical protein